MLADAIRAEGYRLARSRTTWFWSVLFVPLMGLVYTVIDSLAQKMLGDRLVAEGKASPEMILAMSQAKVDMGLGLVGTAEGMAGALTLAFVLIGAATIFAGDYRWETWRLISARNGRDNLILGKVGVLKLLTLAALVAILLASLVGGLLTAFIVHKPLAFTFGAEEAGRFAGFFLLSWLRIVQFMMISLLMAVMTRSLLAALFVPLVVGLMQVASMQLFGMLGLQPDDWIPVLANPGGAVDVLKALIEGGAAAKMLPDGLVLKAAISLGFWTLAPLVGALAWFRRQDLSKE